MQIGQEKMKEFTAKIRPIPSSLLEWIHYNQLKDYSNLEQEKAKQLRETELAKAVKI